ncbi:flagellar hook-length control protein FliK [Methylocapsa acidiphila]|uniref:flagellar hook-length control protein FliK n=1 Tax=Methylocapsa acidiphila TaxID=133552 RepID=UPI0018DDD9A1|nr:flagellar hook-length control protein FliK [Methylocapsa acidiphila]
MAQPGGVRAFKGNSERSADGGSLGTDPVSAPLETALFAAASPSQLAQGNAEPIASPYSAPQGPTARSLAAPISLGVSAVSASDRAGGAGNAPMDVNERAVDRILGSALRAPSDFRASSPSAQSIKATVLGQQTHYPPVAGLSPTQQILDCIAGEPIPGAEAADDAAGPAQTSGAVAATPVTSSVRILDLKLEPDNLGSVTLRLRLAGTQLNLQVEATTPQALRLIDEDKDMLLGKLRASGYSIDALVVKAAQSLTAQGLSASGAAHNASESPTPRVEAPSDPRAQTSGAPQYGEGQSDDHSAPRQDKSRRSGSASDAFPDDRGFGHSNGGDIFI